MIQVCLQTGKIGICPYCLNIAFKQLAEQCDHVQCILCKADFNFCCSSKRDVGIAHGNHYHRIHCPHYAEFNDSAEGPNKDCPECKKLGKKCPRPKPLVNNDVPNEEWEMKSVEFIENNY